MAGEKLFEGPKHCTLAKLCLPKDVTKCLARFVAVVGKSNHNFYANKNMGGKNVIHSGEVMFLANMGLFELTVWHILNRISAKQAPPFPPNTERHLCPFPLDVISTIERTQMKCFDFICSSTKTPPFFADHAAAGRS